MALTYENMKQWIMEYCDTLPSIEGLQDRGRIMEFFAPDFQVRWGDPAIIQNREEWVKYLCGHADDYMSIITYQPEPMGIWIDKRKKTAAMLAIEEFKHSTKGGEPILIDVTATLPVKDVMPKEYHAFYLEFCVHDDKVKAKRMMIMPVAPSARGQIWETA